MFSRDKTSTTDAATSDAPVTDAPTTQGVTDAPVVDASAAGDPVGVTTKGRPTPRRREAEAANKRPLVPTDRRAAAKAARAQMREERHKQQLALQSGDEKHLPPRDKGPVKRYVRDYVDARWNLGEFFLIVALVSLGLMIATVNAPVISVYVTLGLYLIVFATVIDAIIMWQRLKRKIKAKFGEVPSGTTMYAVMRAFQIRRARLPKPRHKKHGVYPE
ncbi:Protein of unknown function (DUF3043) [Sediminihabitans luteus]|uniref:DUF3043 family protein n=1 Tax=Sediminihabitans luteus TaxID=1138585 RepID=A0A2M9CQ26_9CELL|nr:DUF3043 domain-containing protein [Sediminihabitans luteus]PJJ74030.1 Protein of unknown function (DUF3043) [Sediminihabitans luteus]GII98055.1 membrane protein [Sediminihabitans luteus]